MMRWKGLVAVVSAIAAGLIGLSTARADPEEVTIVVRGHRAEQLLAFTEVLSTTPFMGDQLARWDGGICPGLIGMHDHEAAQYMLDRIARRATEVGLNVREPGCLPANFLVYVTTDSDRLSQELSENYRYQLGWSERGVRTAGRAALQDFVETSRPVRWRHLIKTMSGDGGPVMAMNLGPRRIEVFSPSRVRQSTRMEIAEVVIVVDAQRVQGRRLEAISDYVAMVGLAQLDLNTDASAFPSVLNLFAEGAPRDLARTGMTEWDLAYLRGLYTTPPDASADSQVRAIARNMQMQFNSPASEGELR